MHPLPPTRGFWHRQDVLDALHDQDAGLLLRLVRRYTGAGQQGIGAAIGMDQPKVSRVMADRTRVTALATWQRLADGLCMPSHARARLGLAPGEDEPPGTPPASAPTEAGDLWSAPAIVHTIAEDTMGELVKRREVLAAGALLAGAALTETLEPWLSRPPTMVGGHGRLSLVEMDRIEAASAALRHWDSRWRLGIRRRAVLGQLSEITELAQEFQPAAIQGRLFMVMAELSKVVGSMSYDSGDHPTAQRYYTLALRAVHHAGSEHRLYGMGILGDMARQMLDTGHPADALELARLALDTAPSHAPAAVTSLLRTREGWAYARMGRVQGFRRTVGQAEDLLADHSGPVPEWARGFDKAELAGVVGARYRDLATTETDPAQRRRHAQASATYIKQALHLRDPAKRRNRAFDLIGLGRTYLILNEPEEAARVAGLALNLRQNLGSGRVDRRLYDWYRESAAFARDPRITQVRERLSATVMADPTTLKESTS